ATLAPMHHAVTMGSWVSGHAARTPDRIALIFKGEKISYRALDERARRVARGLSELGVRKGDRVAAILLNGPPLIEILLACTHLGAIFLPVNFRLSAGEIAFILDDAAPELVAYSAAFLPVVEQVRAGSRVGAWVQVDGERAPLALPYASL